MHWTAKRHSHFVKQAAKERHINGSLIMQLKITQVYLTPWCTFHIVQCHCMSLNECNSAFGLSPHLTSMTNYKKRSVKRVKAGGRGRTQFSCVINKWCVKTQEVSRSTLARLWVEKHPLTIIVRFPMLSLSLFVVPHLRKGRAHKESRARERERCCGTTA